ncbi:shikimate dehydrogenase [Actinomycetospora succinea]|uniref:Shikimate dehydrogenase (NADP(+)) n=1 Tax=Actinomycetospora succinea TaxID=663603 RepID=A0A4R6VRF1_9PSEU|nr:shikimate dehydrogenase [Actinomycetospora succinea]TDQ65134.1 shikimate dehydrogenase [Actinomycetospora succinea]
MRLVADPDTVHVGLIGAGIGPSLSPALHEREARALGLAYRYTLLDLDVTKADIGDLLAEARDAGLRGVNVTHPVKQRVLPHLDGLSEDAAAIGAVNTVVFDDGRALGHNTDWSGFAAALRTGLPRAAKHRVAVLGAGGAGAAAAHALLTGGAGTVEVLDVDADRAAALAARLDATFGTGRARATPTSALADTLATADGLVHATPTGMAEHPGLPVPAEVLHPRLWVAEIVYRPLRTALLEAATARGCPTLDGGLMAVHQAADALHLFTGLHPDAARMRRHLQELVETREDHRAG